MIATSLSSTVRAVRSFAIVGGVGFVVEAILMTALTQLADWSAWYARIPSFTTAVLVTWLLNRSTTFAGRGPQRRSTEALLYGVIQLCGAGINLAIFATLPASLAAARAAAGSAPGYRRDRGLRLQLCRFERIAVRTPQNARRRMRSMQQQAYSGADNLEMMSEAENYNRYLLDLVRSHASRGGRVLDFGAGGGQFALPLAQLGFDVTALEPDDLLRSRLNGADPRRVRPRRAG